MSAAKRPGIRKMLEPTMALTPMHVRSKSESARFNAWAFPFRRGKAPAAAPGREPPSS